MQASETEKVLELLVDRSDPKKTPDKLVHA